MNKYSIDTLLDVDDEDDYTFKSLIEGKEWLYINDLDNLVKTICENENKLRIKVRVTIEVLEGVKRDDSGDDAYSEHTCPY